MSSTEVSQSGLPGHHLHGLARVYSEELLLWHFNNIAASSATTISEYRNRGIVVAIQNVTMSVRSRSSGGGGGGRGWVGSRLSEHERGWGRMSVCFLCSLHTKREKQFFADRSCGTVFRTLLLREGGVQMVFPKP